MKRLIILFTLFFLLTTYAAADTILLYIEDDWLSSDTTRGAEYIVSSLEDGVMEAFFDAGHIIFNDRSTFGSDYEKNDLLRPSLLLAKKGGAYLMVEVEVVYDLEEETPVALPREVIFQICDVASSRAIYEGSLLADDFLSPPSAELKDVCQRLGAAIAQRVLSLF